MARSKKHAQQKAFSMPRKHCSVLKSFLCRHVSFYLRVSKNTMTTKLKAGLWACPLASGVVWSTHYLLIYGNALRVVRTLNKINSNSILRRDMNFLNFFSDVPTLMCSPCESLRLTAGLYAKIFVLKKKPFQGQDQRSPLMSSNSEALYF